MSSFVDLANVVPVFPFVPRRSKRVRCSCTLLVAIAEERKAFLLSLSHLISVKWGELYPEHPLFERRKMGALTDQRLHYVNVVLLPMHFYIDDGMNMPLLLPYSTSQFLEVW
jgi:hypothetical protein